MPFKKGDPNINRKGRPSKGWAWTELLEEVGEQVEEKSGKKFKELVSKKLWEECAKGNIPAIRELFNRMEGMPKQQTEIQGAVNVFFHDSLKQK